MILVDTNLLARLSDPTHPHHALAHRALPRVVEDGMTPVIVPQCLFEFWAIATRKRGSPPSGANGLDMSPQRADLWIRFFRRRFRLLADPADLVDRWLRLVVDLEIGGFRAHDVRLVAAMQAHQVDRILTFNGKDFAGLGVRVIDPADLSA